MRHYQDEVLGYEDEGQTLPPDSAIEIRSARFSEAKCAICGTQAFFIRRSEERMKVTVAVVLMVILVTVNTVSADINDGLVAYFPFNGNANDESGNGNHGTVYGATLTSDRLGNQGSAYYFNGIDNYIVASSLYAPSISSFTVSYWMKFEWQEHRIWILYFGSSNYCSNNGFHALINTNGEWALSRGDVQNGIDCGVQNGFNAERYEGVWTHVSTVYDAGTATLTTYANAVLMDSKPISSFIMDDIGLYIGQRKPFQDSFGKDSYYKGAIDEVRIYNRALDGTEIQKLYNVTSTPLSAGWNFISFPKQPSNTTIGTILADVSPDIRVVWGYDNANKIWKRHKPGETANSLSDMEAGKGYWIYANNESAINIEGCTDPSSTVHLYEGWNLVGYNGEDGKLADDSLASIDGKWVIVWGWDNGQWSARHSLINDLPVQLLSTFRLGKAYWIRTGAGQAGDWVQKAGATPPGPPTGLMAAEVSENQINLSWADASGNVGVAGYYVYQGATRIADVKATSYSITNFDVNAQSSYTVRAYDASGNISASSALLTVGGGSNTLTVVPSGAGSGKITSTPAGIDCGSTCSASFIKGTSVSLAVTANTNASFANWSGACTGLGTCMVTIDGDKSATAIFNPYRVEASAKIGPAGGVVEITEPSNPLFGTKVDIPADALAQETTITISSVSNPPLASGGLTRSGPCAEFGPNGLQFSKPVAITLPSHSADLAHTSDLIFFDSGGFTIVPNPNDEEEGFTQTIDLAHNRVTAFTDHFTLYQVLEDADIEEQINNIGPNSKTFIGYNLPPNKKPLKTREETNAPIQSIVIHSTDDTLNLSQHASRLNHGATNLFATYYIDACGRILQVAQENETTNHAYTSNTGSIGIELLDVIDEKCDDVPGSYSTAQTKALQLLTEELVQKYDVSADNIVRHYDIAQKIDCTRWNEYPIPLPWKDQKGCEDYKTGWKQDPMAWDNDEWNAFKSSLPSLLCTYSLYPSSKEFGATGGSGSISITTQSGCSWTATSNSSWIVADSSGSGLGIAQYSVTPNTGNSQRTGTITIRGQTFTVTQAPVSPFQGSLTGYWAGSCTYGVYTQDVIGEFSINIDADGKASGNYTGTTSGSISGTVSSTGSYSAGSAGGYFWSGTITRSEGFLSGFGDWNGSEGGYTCKGSWAGPG